MDVIHCADCRYWWRLDDHDGNCVRHAPRPCIIPVEPLRQQVNVYWPRTAATEGCGEAAAKEESDAAEER